MGANWRPLPDDVRGSARRLTEELRAVKDRSGLSLTQIGARTHYSKASWERWFNGKRLITEQALESLAVTVDEGARLLAPLLEQALREEALPAETRPAEAPPVETPPDATPAQAAPAEAAEATPTEAAPVGAAPVAAPPAPRPAPPGRGWHRHLRTVAIAACSALLGGAVGAYLASSTGSHSSPQALGTHAPAPVVSPPPCAGIGCDGKDPQSTGCVKDDRTLITDHVGTIVIYLHYSARCHAAWGALTNAGPGDSATVFTTTGDTQTALVHWGYDNYSMMVDASDPSIGLKVCGKPADKKNAGACTPEIGAPGS